MRLEIAAAAEQELDEAIDWYQSQSEEPGWQFLKELRSTIQRIRVQPSLYVEIHAGIRRGLLNRFPYSVIYEHNDDVLLILAVAHQHRKPFYWLDTSG